MKGVIGESGPRKCIGAEIPVGETNVVVNLDPGKRKASPPKLSKPGTSIRNSYFDR